MKKLIIATRGSKLALWQSEHVKAELEKAHPSLEVELSVMMTKGDKILDTPLAKIGGKGLFTKELEEAMLRGEAHIAVHSLKDVPMEFPKGLKLGVITKREDVRDAMLSEKYASLETLPHGAVVGTTSLRRRMQLLKLRPDFVIKNLRGNVNTRIRKLKEGEFDAIILASAGINRLGLAHEVAHFVPISKDVMIPASGQAALGIEIVDDPEVERLVSVLNDQNAIIETRVERDFVTILEGGCQVPIGVNAEIEGENLHVKAILGMPDGSEMMSESITSTRAEYANVGKALAQSVLERGAKALLERAEAMALNEVF
ncbi:MAG TPA: hydroxymethylbilane synthase [Sulfurospirillum cavolei]|uniref:Porphobilinogen deaminase n=1 Tax=Sulfurospirillum cavolei TaxID=366522 RepID=A0A2D3WK71_9BACT|nr:MULTISPECIES: hydroxymethylbilane synthase [Sulfurospirillum]KHG34233.1 MAG: porphobilinogen deaminase [Sulfurospirillum sp. MES]DAB36923.1 MAG TPA: hydroxymethylbilane synthase [Sulfurospirillum cavolei]